MLDERDKNPGGEPMKRTHRLDDLTGRPATLAEIGVNKFEAHRLQTIARVDDAAFEAQVAEIEAAGQEITSARIYNEARRRERKADIAAQRAAIEAGTATMPAGAFEVVVVDPPWPYGWFEQYNPQHFKATSPYPEMGLGDLGTRLAPGGDLAIPAAADDCVLWCWTTHRFLPHAFPLLAAWGFDYGDCRRTPHRHHLLQSVCTDGSRETLHRLSPERGVSACSTYHTHVIILPDPHGGRIPCEEPALKQCPMPVPGKIDQTGHARPSIGDAPTQARTFGPNARIGTHSGTETGLTAC